MEKKRYSKITVDTDLWKLFQELVYKQEEIVEWINDVKEILTRLDKSPKLKP